MFEFSPVQRLALAAVALAGLVGGAVLLYHQGRVHAPPPAAVTASAALKAAPSADAAADPPADGRTLLVHVAGAVKQPGLYRLAGDARVADALKTAGGARPDARLDDLNLAARLKDGMRLSVPGRDNPAPEKVVVVTEDVWVHEPPKVAPGADGREPSAPETLVVGSLKPKGSHSSSSRRKQPPSGLIDLNHASLEQLRQLPGVGDKTAARIVAYRATQGRFNRPEDLMNVKGIGPKSYERLQPYLTVGAN